MPEKDTMSTCSGPSSSMNAGRMVMALFLMPMTPYMEDSKTKSPIIVIDMEQIVPKNVYQTKMFDQKISTLVLIGRKALGL